MCHNKLIVKFIVDNLILISCNLVSRLQEVVFLSFIFLSHFYFSFDLFFIFQSLEQLGLGLEVIGHTVTSVTIWWYGYNIGHKIWENEVEGSRTNNVMQHRYYMLTSCSTHGH